MHWRERENRKGRCLDGREVNLSFPPSASPRKRGRKEVFITPPHLCKAREQQNQRTEDEGRGEEEAEASREPAEYKVGTDERDQIWGTCCCVEKRTVGEEGCSGSG